MATMAPVNSSDTEAANSATRRPGAASIAVHRPAITASATMFVPRNSPVT